VLKVDATKFKDTAGNAGTNPAAGPVSTSWTTNAAVAGPTVTSITAVATPRTTPVPSVTVTFSKAINTALGLPAGGIILTRGGVAVTPTTGLTIALVAGTTSMYTISGAALSTATTPVGAYVLKVDATKFKDTAGNAGTNPAAGMMSNSWSKTS
jgi:hypothetical protein